VFVLRSLTQSEICEPARGRVQFVANDPPFRRPTMSLNPYSYSQAAMARVRSGRHRYLHPIDTPLPIAPTSALVAGGMVVLK